MDMLLPYRHNRTWSFMKIPTGQIKRYLAIVDPPVRLIIDD